MTPHQLKANQFIQHFGTSIRASLQLKDGVCALYDAEDQEVTVIEVPDHSDSAIFHCSLLTLSSDVSPQKLRKLLLLNFEISAMQGCWLAVDERDNLCLCHVLPLDKSDEQHFSNSLTGFIEQTKDVRAFTQELLRQADAA
ncbi:type III secretion system chaperone [Pokkaliibacter sp. MBI-7]|uniref:type III secretion system chaperone n=1 Tax=Pokkaliibacter sp. MBI-7 TaxID=3040600 RepID=UPI002446BDE3|nr:type III secretion system chaperone [Pokkaliibacter sp. MBI-7]MDH2435675.1 type III secretion system chaperone [Pokkaliibacter sp. MBI-7]